MARESGRNLLLKTGTGASAVTVAGVMSHTFTINNEIVDITDKDSSGYRTLLANAGIKSITVSGNGNATDEAGFATLRTASLGATIDAYTLCLESGGDVITGNFQITSFEIAGDHNSQTTFSFTLESSGTYTFTAGT